MYARPTANTAWPLSISHRIVRSTAYVVRLARGYIAYRNRYVAIERGERFGSDGEGDSDRGDPRGLNESARPRVLHLSPFSVSLFHPSSTRIAFLSPAPSSSRSPPRDTWRSTRSSAITTFIRQVFRTTDRRRWKRNEM